MTFFTYLYFDYNLFNYTLFLISKFARYADLFDSHFFTHITKHNFSLTLITWTLFTWNYPHENLWKTQLFTTDLSWKFKKQKNYWNTIPYVHFAQNSISHVHFAQNHILCEIESFSCSLHKIKRETRLTSSIYDSKTPKIQKKKRIYHINTKFELFTLVAFFAKMRRVEKIK